MRTSVATRIVVALMSVAGTLFVLNSLALYGHPQPASAEARIADNTSAFAASAAK